MGDECGAHESAPGGCAMACRTCGKPLPDDTGVGFCPGCRHFRVTWSFDSIMSMAEMEDFFREEQREKQELEVALEGSQLDLAEAKKALAEERAGSTQEPSGAAQAGQSASSSSDTGRQQAVLVQGAAADDQAESRPQALLQRAVSAEAALADAAQEKRWLEAHMMELEQQLQQHIDATGGSGLAPDPNDCELDPSFDDERLERMFKARADTGSADERELRDYVDMLRDQLATARQAEREWRSFAEMSWWHKISANFCKQRPTDKEMGASSRRSRDHRGFSLTASIDTHTSGSRLSQIPQRPSESSFRP